MADLLNTFLQKGPLGLLAQGAAASRAKVAAAQQKLSAANAPATNSPATPSTTSSGLSSVQGAFNYLIPSSTVTSPKNLPTSTDVARPISKPAPVKTSVNKVVPTSSTVPASSTTTTNVAPGLPGGADPALVQPLPTSGGAPATAGASATPTVPAQPDYQSQLKAAQQAYLASLQPSADVTSATQQLGNVDTQAAADTAAAQKQYADRVAAIQGQATLQPFLTGREQQAQQQLTNQLAAIKAGSEAQTLPLQQRLAQFQAQQQAAQQAAQAQMGFASPTPVSVAAGTSLVNPLTGQALYESPRTPPAAIQEYQYAQQQGYPGSFTQYQQDLAAQQAAVSPSATPASYREWQFAGSPGTYEQWVATKGGTALAPGQQTPQAVKFQQETNQRLGDSVDQALTSISPWVTGAAGAAMMNIPGTPAYNFNQQLQTIKSNIAFGVLQDMRNASKTGGALGQVSDREEAMLSSVLGSLSAAQSTEQLKRTLQNIKDSVQRWNDALSSSSTEDTGSSASAGAGNIDDSFFAAQASQ